MIEMKNVFHANFVRYIHILIILEGVTRPRHINSYFKTPTQIRFGINQRQEA